MDPQVRLRRWAPGCLVALVVLILASVAVTVLQHLAG